MTNLLQKLNYEENEKLLIFNCDDFGSTHSANVAIRESLETGLATTTTLMVPCSWASEAIKLGENYDIGIHLTLNCEYEGYRFRPITKAKSLTTDDGFFFETIPELYQSADIGEVREELTAQIDWALQNGVDITHFDSHIGPLHLSEKFFQVYLELAVKYNVPLRMPDEKYESTLGFPFKKMADEAGVLAPDRLNFLLAGVGSRKEVSELLTNLEPGVTECYFHPAVDSIELRATGDDFNQRIDDYNLLNFDADFKALLDRSGAKLICYKELKNAMRGSS